MLKAPFPWFGGKSRVAHLVWERFGDVRNYVEPFAGSLAVLLARPHEPRIETVNDRDAYLANFWRALLQDPEEVARHADWPVNEADLHARHRRLVAEVEFRERMLTDPDYCNARIAGWWVWGISMWIGSGWCSKPEWTGRGHAGRAPRGLSTSKRPHISSRTLPGVHRQEIAGPKPLMRNSAPWQTRPATNLYGTIHQKRPVMQKDSAKRGALASSPGGRVEIREWMVELAERLRHVRVCCGDWSRVVTPSVTTKVSGDSMVCGVFLDPPYDLRAVRGSAAGSDGAAPTDKLYTHHDNDLSAQVRAWAIEQGQNPLMRIALCGYEGEHAMPADWECVPWKANGGYANQRGTGKGKENAARERIWFSPHCERARNLFEEAA